MVSNHEIASCILKWNLLTWDGNGSVMNRAVDMRSIYVNYVSRQLRIPDILPSPPPPPLSFKMWELRCSRSNADSGVPMKYPSNLITGPSQHTQALARRAEGRLWSWAARVSGRHGDASDAANSELDAAGQAGLGARQRP